MWIDSHCHLDAAEFDPDRDAVAAAALAAGVGAIVVPGVVTANFPAVRACCRRYPGCRAAYGIHPLFVDGAGEAELAVLRRWLRDAAPLAVGEIGLDGFVAGVDRLQQETIFVAQLRLAREFELPVILHVRRAVDEVLKQLRRIPVRGGIAHAFNGSRQQAEQFIELGFKLGFGGAMTFTRATRIRDLAASLPAEAIVLETDAPDIAPVFSPSRRNAPALLPAIGACLAELRATGVHEIARQTAANAVAALPGLVLPWHGSAN